MPLSIFRVGRDGEPIATVPDLAGLELFGEDALSGIYTIDVIHSEPIDGHTSWRWGKLTESMNGIVEVVGEELPPRSIDTGSWESC